MSVGYIISLVILSDKQPRHNQVRCRPNNEDGKRLFDVYLSVTRASHEASDAARRTLIPGLTYHSHATANFIFSRQALTHAIRASKGLLRDDEAIEPGDLLHRAGTQALTIVP